MSDETRDVLSRWWWPGQWLRIVWGVWVDQLWYWHNVRPRLSNWKQGQDIFIQGVLGATLVTACLTVLLGGVLEIVGLAIEWRRLGVGMAGSLTLMLFLSLTKGVVKGLVLYASLGVTLGISLGILAAFWNRLVSLPVIPLIMPLVILVPSLLLIGIARGIYDVITTGKMDHRQWRYPMIVGGMIFLFLLLIQVVSGAILNLYAAIVSLFHLIYLPISPLVFGIGSYIGGHWANRQVSDDEHRKILANPLASE